MVHALAYKQGVKLRMKLGVFVILAATLLFCDALMPVKLMIKRVKEARGAVTSLSRIVKRQSSQCISDFGRLESDPKLKICEQIAEEFEDNDQIPSSTADRYCSQGCGTYLLYWYKTLAKDCDYFDNPDMILDEYIQQSCSHTPNNDYCLIVWDKSRNASFYPSSYAALHLFFSGGIINGCDTRLYCMECSTGAIGILNHDIMNSNCLSEIYSGEAYFYLQLLVCPQCIQEFDPSTSACPRSCTLAEQWITRTFGCCYRALLDYEEYDEYIQDYFGEKYWENCGIPEPKLCTN